MSTIYNLPVDKLYETNAVQYHSIIKQVLQIYMSRYKAGLENNLSQETNTEA
jgi:hypothetical protein